MTRHEYLKVAFESFNFGRIDEETYDCMIENVYIFSDEDEDYDERLPSWYAEIEYNDFDSAEAIDCAKWDDMNYRHYMER